ncbi:MAG TPA: DUF2249 domain-containing protein [Rhodothermales bacterium]|nr:DUF2249 domain-containing protein [Rhodothermales bacterium]
MRTTTQASAEVLDVRPVEPKHRFEAIMGAWGRLGDGEVLDLIVDHDPQCMYYTLKAEYGDESFSFDYIERGPENWRVLVTRHAN